MAENNITSLTINFILIGMTLLALLSSYILITNNEGRGEIFDPYPEIQEFNLNLSQTYSTQIVETANINTNLSSSYNPELAISAADQSGNAMALNQQDLVSATWDALSIFGSLVFGNIWTIILSGLIGALVTFLFSYYFIRWIRSGN